MKRFVFVLALAFYTASIRADESIPAKTLADIKGATVFIKAKAGPLQMTGSGFLIQADGKTGYIVTNQHVVVPDTPRFDKADSITIVFHSGLKQEASYAATLLAADKERDLAVLKVVDVKEMPTPLDLTQKVDLVETLPVFAVGFPFGDALSLTRGNPNITVGKGTVSSIRLNERQQVGLVQIDGDLNPGNSGGPVVDSKGRLVGIAVARVKGTRIGLAIPSSELAAMLNGRVAGLNTRSKRLTDTTTEVEVEVALIDPLNRIKEVEVHFQLERLVRVKPRVDPAMEWTLMRVGSKSKTSLEGQVAKCKVTLTATEKGLVPFGFQVTCVTGDGKRVNTQMTTHKIEFGEAVVVKPVGMSKGKDDPPPSPVVLKDTVEQAVPSISDAIIGGSGRFLIIHSGEKRKLFIWDVYLSKMVKELPVASDHAFVAAGKDQLVVILPTQKLIQRYDFKTFERDSTALRVEGEITAAVMGSASSGPLVLATKMDRRGEAVQFLDPVTLKSIDYKLEGKKTLTVTGSFLRASANGQVFTARLDVGGEPHRCASIVLAGDKLVSTVAFIDGSMLLPTPDGSRVCADSAVYDRALKPVFPREPSRMVVDPFLPAHQGGYFMRLNGVRGEGQGKLSLFLPGHEKPFAVLDKIEGYIGSPIAYGKVPNSMMHDKRVFLVPEAQKLLTIPLSNDKLIVREVDLDQLLQKSGQSFLFVSSQPPTVIREGASYQYQVIAKSNKGAVKVKLESGPMGMKVSPQGLVEWQVPKKTDRSEYEVVLSITDSDGQEVFHTFTVTVE